MKRRSVLQGVFTVLLTGCFLYFVLPYLLTIYLREVLKTIPGYYTKFESVQINFLKGAYTIDSLKVYKTNGIDTLPFVNAPRLELSLDWDALLDGRVASKIELKEPSFNFIFDRNRTRKQDGEFVNWTGVLTRLQPLRFNRVCVKNATVSYYDFTSAPQLHLFVYQLQLDIQDLISSKKEGLPRDCSYTRGQREMGY